MFTKFTAQINIYHYPEVWLGDYESTGTWHVVFFILSSRASDINLAATCWLIIACSSQQAMKKKQIPGSLCSYNPYA